MARAVCSALALFALSLGGCDAIPSTRPDSGFDPDARILNGCLMHREHLELPVPEGSEPDNWDNFAQSFFVGYCSGCHSSTRRRECDCLDPPMCTMRDPSCARNGAPAGFYCTTGMPCCVGDPMRCTPPEDGRCRAAASDACTTDLPSAIPDFNWDDRATVERHLVDIRSVVVVSNFMPFTDSPYYTPPRPTCALRVRLGAWIDSGAP